jgi:type IV secretion system protein VirB1
MDTTAFIAVALACAPQVDVATAQALVRVESAFNPWAIGVVGGQLERQAQSRAEALSTAKALDAAGWNFSVGLGQINVRNFGRLGLTIETAFAPCANLAAMQAVLLGCYRRARAPPNARPVEQVALRRALSCYYSGDFATGFRDRYVSRVFAASTDAGHARPLISRK